MSETAKDHLSGAIALGRQMTVEFYDCAADILADAKRLEEVFLTAAQRSGAHVVNSTFHSFEPQGVSGVVVISESHFAVHAWPEHDYAAVDLFTCGSGVDFTAAVKALAEGMNSGQWIISSMVNRGILHESGQIERLVPVVENERNCGLQLSWKERFDRSAARAISTCIDLYNCKKLPVKEEECRKTAGELNDKLSLTSGKGKWIFISGEREKGFTFCGDTGRISGTINPESGAVSLDIFKDGFFDPRPVAEFAMTVFEGGYYRMQVQIRQ